jgi:hypothetical protein
VYRDLNVLSIWSDGIDLAALVATCSTSSGEKRGISILNDGYSLKCSSCR